MFGLFGRSNTNVFFKVGKKEALLGSFLLPEVKLVLFTVILLGASDHFLCFGQKNDLFLEVWQKLPTDCPGCCWHVLES